MTHALIRAAGVLTLLLALSACAQTQTQAVAPVAEQTQAAALAAEPTAEGAPRPDAPCGPAQVILYFGEQVASDEPVVTPLLNDFIDRIRRCEATGNTLRSITIATLADPHQSASDARAQVHRRVERVRAALVNAGAPGDKIVQGEIETTSPVMGRRAEITAVFN